MFLSVFVHLVYLCVFQEMPRWGEDRSYSPRKEIISVPLPREREATSAPRALGVGAAAPPPESQMPERLPRHPHPPAHLKLNVFKVSSSYAAIEKIPPTPGFCKKVS